MKEIYTGIKTRLYTVQEPVPIFENTKNTPNNEVKIKCKYSISKSYGRIQF